MCNFWGKRLFLAIAGALLAVVSSPSLAETIHPERGLFLAARSWFQFEEDVPRSLFRSYATLKVDGEIADFPNLFIMNCSDAGSPYLTIHFPENYAFSGFGPAEWIPETKVFIRIPGGTYRFDAELNKNEFYIDLTDERFDSVTDIWATDGTADFKLGPNNANMTLSFASIEDAIGGLLRQNGRKIAARYSFLEMRTRCHAVSHAGEKGTPWKVFGSVSCASCSLHEGKSFMFITISANDAKSAIKTAEECASAKENLLAAFGQQKIDGQNVVADLLCVGDGGWR